MENKVFTVGDSAVYPGHGLGRFVSITFREGIEHLVWQGKGMQALVPPDKCASSGFRAPMTADESAWFLAELSKVPEPLTGTWEEQYAARMSLIKAGDPGSLLKALQILFLELKRIKQNRDNQGGLGTYRMYQTVVQYCAEETAFATGRPVDAVKIQIVAALENAGT